MNSRYLFGEAWAIAKSGPRHTAIAVTLIALAFYVPGLFALLARNLGRLAGGAESPVAAVFTLDPAADAQAGADPPPPPPPGPRARPAARAAAPRGGLPGFPPPPAAV